MTQRAARNVLIVATLSVLGILVPFWPLIVVGIAWGVVSGLTTLPLVVSILCDLVFGTPVGWLHFVPVPFMLITLLCIAVRVVLHDSVRQSSPNVL